MESFGNHHPMFNWLNSCVLIDSRVFVKNWTNHELVWPTNLASFSLRHPEYHNHHVDPVNRLQMAIEGFDPMTYSFL